MILLLEAPGRHAALTVRCMNNALLEQRMQLPQRRSRKGICMGAVLANAVFDAAGARVLELPMTPERILAALKQGRTAARPGRARSLSGRVLDRVAEIYKLYIALNPGDNPWPPPGGSCC
jgi:hypothetical protein